jgi:hypothetical protein
MLFYFGSKEIYFFLAPMVLLCKEEKAGGKGGSLSPGYKLVSC